MRWRRQAELAPGRRGRTGALPRATAVAFLAENGPQDRFPGARKPRDISNRPKREQSAASSSLRKYPPGASERPEQEADQKTAPRLFSRRMVRWIVFQRGR